MNFRISSRDGRCNGVALVDEDGGLVASYRTTTEAARAKAILSHMSVVSRGSRRSSHELNRVAMDICRRQHGHEHFERLTSMGPVLDLLSAAGSELKWKN